MRIRFAHYDIAIAALALATTSTTADDAECQLPQNSKYTGYTLKLGTGCAQFLYCQNGVLSSTNTCPEHTLYTGDVGNGGICSWESMVACKEGTPVTPPTITSAEAGPATTTTATATDTDNASANTNTHPTSVGKSPHSVSMEDDPGNNYCGTDKYDASQNCLPCPSGFAECSDPRHGCFVGVAPDCGSAAGDGALTIPSFVGPVISGSGGSNASKLASDLRVMINMEQNFDHGADCSMGDWGLCYTKTLTLEYIGEENYLSK